MVYSELPHAVTQRPVIRRSVRFNKDLFMCDVTPFGREVPYQTSVNGMSAFLLLMSHD